MKKIICSLLFLMFLMLPVVAQNAATVTTGNPNVQASAHKGMYGGRNCLIVTLKDGKIPINAPGNRVKLLTGEENGNKSFYLQQIAPGKFVTTEPIVLDEAYFTLKILGSNRIKDIAINFKTRVKENPAKAKEGAK